VAIAEADSTRRWLGAALFDLFFRYGKHREAKGLNFRCADGALGFGFSLNGGGDGFRFARGNFVPGEVAGFLDVVADRRLQNVSEAPDFNVAHSLSSALEEAVAVRKLAAAEEAEIDVAVHHGDVANAVFHFRRRAVVDGDDVNLDDVFVTRSEFFEKHLAERESKLLDSGVEWFEEFQKFAGRFCHGEFLARDGSHDIQQMPHGSNSFTG
jgi:hypothetical protein